MLFNSNAFSTVLNVPEQYSTIQAAFTAAQSGDTVQVNSGLHNLSYHLYVNNGITFKLMQGVIVNFLTGFTVNQGSIFQTCGNSVTKVYVNVGSNIILNIYGKALCEHTIFANVSQGSTW